MALVPYSSWWRDWWDDFDRPQRLLDHHFGLTLRQRDLLRSLDLPWYYRPYWWPWRSLIDGVPYPAATINDDDTKYEIVLDVGPFLPSEIIVRTKDNSIIIEAKHEEKRYCPQRTYTRELMRRYDLPKGLDINRVMSNLSTDGILTVSAPKIPVPAPYGERIIPIERLAFPAIKS